MDGEERELLLFTNGFMLCRVDLNAHVNLLLDVSSGRIQHKGAQRIQEQYDHDHGRDISGNYGGEAATKVCMFLYLSDGDLNISLAFLSPLTCYQCTWDCCDIEYFTKK